MSRIFYYFSASIDWIKKKLKKCKTKEDIEAIESEPVTEVDNYLVTLENVMKYKFESDYENSTKDNFADLKKDLENIIKEKLSKCEQKLTTSINSLKRKSNEWM